MSEQLTFYAPVMPPPNMREQEALAGATFEAFWKAYPKRPNNPKEPARSAWQRALRTATVTEIMDGLARYQFSDEPKFRPMASTWLNQKRWQIENEDLTIDGFGVAEWLANLSCGEGLSAASYDPDELRAVLVAVGWPPTWRGSLEVLGGWMRDGYMPDSCARVIAAAVAIHGSRASLSAFDKVVRFRADRLHGVS